MRVRVCVCHMLCRTWSGVSMPHPRPGFRHHARLCGAGNLGASRLAGSRFAGGGQMASSRWASVEAGARSCSVDLTLGVSVCACQGNDAMCKSEQVTPAGVTEQTQPSKKTAHQVWLDIDQTIMHTSSLDAFTHKQPRDTLLPLLASAGTVDRAWCPRCRSPPPCSLLLGGTPPARLC